MRPRIIDINCRLFWFTLFFRVDHSPKTGYHIESNLYEYQRLSGSWFHFWKWEPLPDMRPQVALKPRSEGLSTLSQEMENPSLRPGVKSRFAEMCKKGKA
jgi:hypothetical protein